MRALRAPRNWPCSKGTMRSRSITRSVQRKLLQMTRSFGFFLAMLPG
jgi:hypothetical protein